jgi:TolA-binding protein
MHIPVYLAGLIVLSCMACLHVDAPLTEQIDPPLAAQIDSPPLEHVHLLMSRGDFEDALKECQDVLSRYPQVPPGDEALYSMGLIYVHSKNPKKDFKKSLGFFSRVLKEFPGSTRAEEAKIWIGLLEAIEKSRQVDIQVEEKKQELVK